MNVMSIRIIENLRLEVPNRNVVDDEPATFFVIKIGVMVFEFSY